MHLCIWFIVSSYLCRWHCSSPEPGCQRRRTLCLLGWRGRGYCSPHNSHCMHCHLRRYIHIRRCVHLKHSYQWTLSVTGQSSCVIMPQNKYLIDRKVIHYSHLHNVKWTAVAERHLTFLSMLGESFVFLYKADKNTVTYKVRHKTPLSLSLTAQLKGSAWANEIKLLVFYEPISNSPRNGQPINLFSDMNNGGMSRKKNLCRVGTTVGRAYNGSYYCIEYLALDSPTQNLERLLAIKAVLKNIFLAMPHQLKCKMFCVKNTGCRWLNVTLHASDTHNDW